MSPAFKEHPLRHSVTAELHARTFDPLPSPARVFHLAAVCGERRSGANAEHLLRLLDHFGVRRPEQVGQYYAVDLGGGLWLRWERHTEFVTYTFSRHERFNHPFTDPLINELPQDWLREIPGQVVTATALALESCEMPERGSNELLALFEGNPFIGSEVVGGSSRAWSDLRIHSDGYSRILLRDCGLSENQAGRLAKRILEVDAYRAMALLGLPAAREATRALSEAERRLVALAARMTEGNDHDRGASESELLAELTTLATEIETVAARTIYRFEASRAYYRIVQQRLEQLRQRRIEGLQTFTEFLEARLAPAIATCDSTRERQQDLAKRAARLASLLRARVEVDLQHQNRGLLESMDRRARIQLRLQETVEGLSVIAIGYYGVGLVGYALKGLEAQGLLPIDATLGMGLSVPIVVGAAWLGLKRMKRRLLDGHH
ncbi:MULTISPECIES: DUF3422 family protein [Marichromatium]|uniref:Putative membrane-anchored protein n=1 Tax=Marichromatium gracile TaxID=1048 RepID=A0A4R4ACS2_MARGR|nr:MULTISPECIES: DUF3422 domain-containing protein [Marichromatium]MBO8087628.1 DUF3422 domain-containing protein [Marichromatium sp.]MBK1709019.1 hypothetical protein [Marichromatium gracile]RNE91670.1 DUF3422 domain-containing protein [Marichromatium sp. AB31]RNE93387.1 DUF3422 domain-containing protein [Marichromatium sp. AB32]TCW36853.1 putative membrane-anchored protein [Marichromatium gracile]